MSPSVVRVLALVDLQSQRSENSSCGSSRLDDLLRAADARYERRRNRDADGALLGGIRLARNAVVHGVDVVGVTRTTGSAMGGVAIGGTFAGTQIGSICWLARSSIPFTPNTAAQQQKASYDSELSGKQMRPTLHRTLGFLQAAANT
jgi:hypothetical protein